MIKPLLVLVAIVIIPIAERLKPTLQDSRILTWERHERAAWARLGRNIGLFALASLTSLLVLGPVTQFGEALGWGIRPIWWSGALGLILDILILDCWIYWWHRANHEIGFLWRFHRVHHLDEILDSSSALRFHFGEIALSALARLPVVVLLGMPLSNIALFEALVLTSAIFHHSIVAIPPAIENRLSRVIITPSIHWVHHHKIQQDTDSNYGTIFSFWDRLFRSRSMTCRWRDMPIGIEGESSDLPLVRLIAAPFRPQRQQSPLRSEPFENTSQG